MTTQLDENQREELERKVKKEIEYQNKILKSIFLVIGVGVVFCVLVVLIFNQMNKIEYRGVNFEKEKYCDTKPCLVVYKTTIPLISRDSITGKAIDVDYNIYLRTDPRKLESVNVEGDITFRPNMVIGLNTEDLYCDGDWVIAMGNLNKLSVLGVNLMPKNESEIKLYVPESQYMFVDIGEGNETSIVQIGSNTYKMNVANCEILKATERLMVEAFSQAHGK